MKKYTVILSGGFDSTTCLFWAIAQAGGDAGLVQAVAFDYGQLSAIELESATKVAELAGADLTRISIPGALRSTSPLLNQWNDEGEPSESAFVPFRNAVFLTIAANHALSSGSKDLVIGIVDSDNEFSDCTSAFIQAQTLLLREAVGDDAITIHAPLVLKNKREVVEMASTLPGCFDAIAYTHTAYDNEYPPSKTDVANVQRAQGFEDAGLPDPLVLRAVREGLMALPTTENYK